MILKQLSVTLENNPGELSRVSDMLGDEGINVRAITAATESGASVVRFLSFKNDKEHELGETPIPGGMLKVYRNAGINKS